MRCDECVFYNRLQQNHSNIPCVSCTSDLSDKGFCVAVASEFGLVPVITKIFEEERAREIIARGAQNGGRFTLLQWSNEVNAYLPA